MKLIPASYRLRHLPLRLVTGAFLLNSGLGKRDVDADMAAGLHAGGVTAFPPFENVEPETFAKGLSHAETALGVALLAPWVPSGLAGAGLAAFSGGLMSMYVRNPELREPGSLSPSPAGMAVSKDSWLLAIGLSLVADACMTRRARRRG